MTLEKLKALLESGSITQEEFDEMAANIKEEKPATNPDPVTDPVTEEKEETLEKLYQSRLDRAMAKERKENAALKKENELLKKKSLSEAEKLQYEFDKEREQFELERKEFELAKRKTYALKAMKKAEADDCEEANLLIEKLVVACEDDTEIDETITLLKAIFEKRDKRTTDRIFKENGYAPQKGSNLNGGVNPYKKEQFSFTEQMRLEVENPELARQLQSEAGML